MRFMFHEKSTFELDLVEKKRQRYMYEKVQ